MSSACHRQGVLTKTRGCQRQGVQCFLKFALTSNYPPPLSYNPGGAINQGGGDSTEIKNLYYGFYYDLIPGREKFCPGKLTLVKILPGKNSDPELKTGGKNSVPKRFGRGKRKFGAKRRGNFWLLFLVNDKMKLNFP